MSVMYQIVSRASGLVQGAYTRANITQTLFESADEARNSLSSGERLDTEKYRVQAVMLKVIEHDVDCSKGEADE